MQDEIQTIGLPGQIGVQSDESDASMEERNKPGVGQEIIAEPRSDASGDATFGFKHVEKSPFEH
jgi:hypothetical protein